MAEVKRAFNPEFLNRLDEVILFTSLTDEDLLKIIHLLVEQININLVAKQIKIRLNDDAARVHPREDTARIAATALVRCAARSRSTSRIRCREALIQGSLPRPAELEVYLGDTGIYCRPVGGELRNSPWGARRRDRRLSRPPAHRSTCSNHPRVRRVFGRAAFTFV